MNNDQSQKAQEAERKQPNEALPAIARQMLVLRRPDWQESFPA